MTLWDSVRHGWVSKEHHVRLASQRQRANMRTVFQNDLLQPKSTTTPSPYGLRSCFRWKKSTTTGQAVFHITPKGCMGKGGRTTFSFGASFDVEPGCDPFSDAKGPFGSDVSSTGGVPAVGRLVQGISGVVRDDIVTGSVGGLGFGDTFQNLFHLKMTRFHMERSLGT